MNSGKSPRLLNWKWQKFAGIIKRKIRRFDPDVDIDDTPLETGENISEGNVNKSENTDTAADDSGAAGQTKLAEDETMQSLALGIMIRKKIDDILIAGKISEKEKEDLKKWVALRNTLLNKKNEKKSVPATKK